MPSRANRNLCNEYVWSAQAGLYSISSHNIDSRTTELGGTASWGLKGSRGFSADVAIVGVSVSGSLDCTSGMQVHLTSSKTSETESGFELSSSLPGAMDLRLVDGSGYLAPPGTEAERRKVGAVTDYRFMTFYLESSSDNMRVFFNTVVDPVWLESKDPDAVALKACTNRDTGMAWRVLHRVTYVSRVLGPITGVQEQEATGTSVKLDKPDIAGNLQLLKALAPYVTTAKTKADLVPVLHEAFAKEYPMLMLSDERMGDVLDLVMFHYDLE